MKIKNYISVKLRIPEEYFEIAYAILSDYPFIGMEEKLDEIILFFDEKDWNEDIKQQLVILLNDNIVESELLSIEIIPDKNWNEEWEKSVEPIKISDELVITPEWKLKDFNCKWTIIINPKMSFGTGQHSTTKLMATMIEMYLTKGDINRTDEIWIDAGTGTGVLAIIAAKLGVKQVFAFDNDEWSYENAQENIFINNVEHIVKVECCSIDDVLLQDAHCICANMFFLLIKNNFSKFRQALTLYNGILFVSGILLFDRDELLASATENGFALLEEMQELEWCCFKFGLQ